jgi:extracellular factor (EF) 3-hydroxypalmitic acid methyl ester biosynthesis protein
MFHSDREMSQVVKSNGNGNGTSGLFGQLKNEAEKPQVAGAPSGVKESRVTFQTREGVELQGALSRVTHHAVVFELYNPGVMPRLSETLGQFKIIFRERTVYSGRAVVSNLVDAGSKTVCDATLDESHWTDLNFTPESQPDGQLAKEFKAFIHEWQQLYKVSPEFKVVIADMQTFLTDLRLWLEQVELGLRSAPDANRPDLARETADALGRLTLPALTNLFEKFESTLQRIDPDLQPAHQSFGRRQLHPMLLCSPFLYRCFSKPLGYAGDYEMVNMMMRDPLEGGSLYAKIINLWFLSQPPAEAHRNRIRDLAQQIEARTARAAGLGRTARILNVGCGPAHEVRQFLQESHLADRAQFTLMDFNEETLTHCQTVLEEAKKQSHRITPIKYFNKSVQKILKGSAKSAERATDEPYDFIYCAGLFDYLSDSVCRKLTNIYYEWLVPGGLLLTTNVDVYNPRRITMDYIMEWHLFYRKGADLLALKPDTAPDDLCAVKSDSTGVNIYFEAQKPDHV